MKNILAPVLDDTKYRSCFTNLAMLMDNEGTFTRASSATVWKDGVLTTVGVNVARFADGSEIDDTIGYISEGASTNLFPFSDNFSSWGDVNVVIASDSTTSPDGTVNADKITTDGSGNSYVEVSQNVTLGSDYTVTVYAKAGTSQKITFRAFYGLGTIDFDIATQVFTVGTTPKDYGYEDTGDGWYRIYMVVTATVTAASNARIYVSRSIVLVEDLYLWRAQFEASSHPSSPIFTSGASATRAADQNSSKVHKWYNPSGYVLYFEFEVPSNDTSRVIAELRDKNNTTTERLTLKVNDWDAIELEIYRDTKQVFIQDNVNFVPNTLNKVAVVVKENSCSLYVNGVHFATDTDCIIPELDTIYLGKPSWDGWYLNGNIKLAGAFPKVLTNTELEGLTT